jgi:hypothetical protein
MIDGLRWRHTVVVIVTLAVASALWLPTVASASFGFLPGAEGFDASVVKRDGSPSLEAGTHPYAMHIDLGLNRDGQFSDGDLRNLDIAMPPSLFASPVAISECNQAQFHTPRLSPFQESLSGESCPDASQVGTVAIHSSYKGGSTRYFGVFNLTPPFGSIEAIGFAPFGTPIMLTGHSRESDAALTFDLADLPQQLSIYGMDLTLWGMPWAEPAPPAENFWAFPHDNERGNCLNEVDPESPFGETAKFILSGGELEYVAGTCSVGGDPRNSPPKSYLTLPTGCEGPLRWTAQASSWQQSTPVEASAVSRNIEGNPAGLEKCKPPLPTAQAQLSTESAASASGFAFRLDLGTGGGILNALGVARPPIRTAVASLPEGLTINPSVGAGLGVCSEADFARESVASAPGAGCPNASKIGDVSVEGMIGIPEVVQGSVFLAKPYENPYGSLIALFMVAKSPRRGVMLKSIGKVDTDPRSGRLVATFENLPQLLYGRFNLRFREGQRAMMISPPTCGAYTAQLDLTPWTEPGARASSSSTMPISRGEGGGSCPGGTRPFNPHLTAGSYNPVAGAYSPFLLHMTRTDSDQEITSYSATFPPGLLAKLAGVSTCSDAAIEAAKHRSAAAEEASPSCPASSRIGTSMVGEGVGQTLAYAPGALYLAGPYNGSQLSIAAITAARVGPFDLDTVVVRSAIRVDPRTAQASIDAKGSDPIPHILKGIPIHVRDITVEIDRPSFTINPTSCDPLSASSTLTGAGPDVFSGADDVSGTAPDRFQVLDCAALGFAPRVKLKMKGGTKRGKYPSLKATVTPRPGNANIGTASVALPPSIFLAQEHLKTICTRRQFDLGTCPAKSIYGKARAVTPLLDEPLEGPVYLRSSSTVLPDLVAQIRGRGVTIEVVGRIDSVRGGLRATYDVLPDAPVTSFVMDLPGGKRGLMVNSENTCAAPQFATVRMSGQNNVTQAFKSRLDIKCKKKRKQGKHR